MFLVFSIFYSGHNTYESKKNSIWYISYLDNIKEEKRITMFSDFIFQGYYLHGERKHLKPVRLDFFGRKINRIPSHDVLKNYIYPSDYPVVNAGFCARLVENLIKNEIDLIVLSRDQQNIFPPQSCDELYREYQVVHEHSRGVVVARTSHSI